MLEKMGDAEIDLVILDNVFHDYKAEVFDTVVRMARSDIAVVMQAAVPIRRILDVADVIHTPYLLNPRNQPIPPNSLSKLSVYGADAIELKDGNFHLGSATLQTVLPHSQGFGANFVTSDQAHQNVRRHHGHRIRG